MKSDSTMMAISALMRLGFFRKTEEAWNVLFLIKANPFSTFCCPLYSERTSSSDKASLFSWFVANIKWLFWVSRVSIFSLLRARVALILYPMVCFSSPFFGVPCFAYFCIGVMEILVDL